MTAKDMVYRATMHAHSVKADETTFYDVAEAWLDQHRNRFKGKYPQAMYEEAKRMLNILRSLWEIMKKDRKGAR